MRTYGGFRCSRRAIVLPPPANVKVCRQHFEVALRKLARKYGVE